MKGLCGGSCFLNGFEKQLSIQKLSYFKALSSVSLSETFGNSEKAGQK